MASRCSADPDTAPSVPAATVALRPVIAPATPSRPAWPRWAVAVLVLVVLTGGIVAVAVRAGDGGGEPEGDGGAAVATTTTITTPASAEETNPSSALGPRSPFADLEEQIAELRALPWLSPPDLRVVSKDELAAEVRRIIARDAEPEEDAITGTLLKLLGLIPEDLDYPGLIEDLYAEQVLGFYDSETAMLYVGRSGDGDLQPATRYVVAHELVHALTDQHFGFGDLADRLDDEGRTEELAALSALAEGDASLIQARWVDEHLSAAEQLAALRGTGTGSSVLARAPRYILEGLYFPYEAGEEFVGRLLERGDLGLVDEAYRRPPASTEHILHPDTYLAGEQADAPPIDDIGGGAAGCDAVREGAIGEFDTRHLLDVHLGSAASEAAARGWNGDTFVLLTCGAEPVLVDRWRGDTEADAAELAEALGRWVRRWSGRDAPLAPDGRFAGPDGAGRIRLLGDTVELVLARGLDAADRVVGAIG